MEKYDNPVFRIIYRINDMASAAVFTLLCISVSAQVISRYVFNYSFRWSEELPIFFFLWVCFLAAASSFRDGSHLSVSFLYDRFPPALRKVLLYLNLTLSLTFFIVLLYYELMVTLSVRDSTFVVMRISKAFKYVGIPVSCALFGLYIIERLIGQIKADARGDGGNSE